MRQSERDEFDAFVLGAWARLFRTAHALTGNRHDAEDVLQNAFAKAYSNWRRVRRADSPEAYVHRIVANETISAWRRRRRQVERTTDLVPESAGDGHADAVSSRTTMWAAIQDLPPRQRAIVVLRYYEDLSERDIAQVLGVSPGTVKSQASTALRNLRQQLHPQPIGDWERA